MSMSKQGFKSLPIYKQFLIIGASSILLIAIAVVGIVVVTKEMLIRNASGYTDASIMRMDVELDNLSKQLDVIGRQFQTSKDCHKMFTTNDFVNLSFRTTKAINDSVDYVKSVHPNVADVSFVNENIHMSELYSNNELDALFDTALSGNTAENHFLGLRTPSVKATSDKPFFVFCCYVYENGRVIGVALFSMEIDSITPIYASKDAHEEYWFMDFTNNMYSLGTHSLFDEETVRNHCIRHRETLLRFSNSESTPIYYPYSSKNNFFVSMHYSDRAKTYLVCAVSLKHIKSLMSGMQNHVILIISMVIIFTAIQLFIMYTNLIKPINRFNIAINDIKASGKRHLTEPINVIGCAEVRNLASDFTDMFNTINQLNVKIYETSSRLYEEKIKVQTAEISYFRSQINPHFLYNVLAMIRAEAQKNNVPEIESIAMAMGKMYRYNTKGNAVVTLKEEMEVTKAYIEIQKLRFKNRFEVIYNIPEETLQVPVIKLILQPFVENAIIHGIEPALSPCMLYIGCSLKDDFLYIEIRDDGVGIDPVCLNELRSHLTSTDYDTSKNVGIMNTNARIRLEYGEKCGVDIASTPNDGCVVTLRLGTHLELK